MKTKIAVYYREQKEGIIRLNNKEIEKNKRIIKVYGNKATIEKTIKFLEQLNLNGNEDNDRLLIQECTDIQLVDLEKISLDKFKEIIEKCDWRVIPTDIETDWELEVNLNKDNKFSFILDVSSGSVAAILFNLYKYNKDYDADEYIEEAVESREYSYIPPVRRIVVVADLIGEKLSKLVSDLFYKCRIEIENINKYEKTLEKEKER